MTSADPMVAVVTGSLRIVRSSVVGVVVGGTVVGGVVATVGAGVFGVTLAAVTTVVRRRRAGVVVRVGCD
jgi:hypothetical protein